MPITCHHLLRLYRWGVFGDWQTTERSLPSVYACDIDILGDPSNLAEIELILATTTTLGKLGFKNFQIRINERRILKAMAAYSGFPEESYDSVFIILDKMDKIGLEGVKEELIKYEFSEESVNKYVSLFKEIEQQANPIDYLAEKLGDYMEDDVKQWMNEIIESVKATSHLILKLYLILL